MKYLIACALVWMTIGSHLSCDAQTGKPDKTEPGLQSGPVEVFYFHFNRRCETCNAVESVSREAVAELYGDQVHFTSFNLDEESGEEIAKTLEVAGQTLLIVANDTRIDITNEGFLHALSNPGKLKAVLKEKIDPLLP